MWSDVYGLSTVSLRYLNIYGPRFNLRGAYTAALGKFILQRLEDKPMTIWGDGAQTRDYTHVSDVVNANLLAMESDKVGAGEVINIGTGKSLSVNELAKLIGGPVVHEEGRKESKHVLADISKAKDLLGFKPMISLEKGVEELKKLCVSKN
jgi:nucleoside-diphosphate-sugar epimerase